MPKKDGGISSLLKSDRAKKFKDTSFIWNSQVNDQELSLDELKDSAPKSKEEVPISPDHPDRKVGARWEQSGNKVGTPEVVLPSPASLGQAKAITCPGESNPLNPDSLLPAARELGINREQTGYKVGTDREQTGNKLGTNWEQTGYKVGTAPSSSEEKTEELDETGNKLGTKVGTVPGTNWEQTGNKVGTQPGTNWEQTREKAKEGFNFLSLTGLQQKITYFFYEQCKGAGSKKTPNIALCFIAESLQTTTESIKVSIKRLQKKNILQKSSYKNGRGGWSQYTMSDEVYREILQLETGNKLGTIWEQTRSKLGTNTFLHENLTGNKVGTKLGTTLPSSSSFLNINNTTTTKAEDEDQWREVQIPPLLRSLNFGHHIIKQVRDRNLLDPDELQQSLDAFSFDLSENDIIKLKKIGDPVRYFMGIISKKMQYAPPSNFINDEDKALEENKKRLAEIKKKREEAERIEVDLAFEEWLSHLSKEDKVGLVPENNFFKVGTPFHTQMLRAHFDESLKRGISPEPQGLSQ